MRTPTGSLIDDIADLIRRLYVERSMSEFRLSYSAPLRGTKNELKRVSANEPMVLSEPVSEAFT